jgi:hypothetical protein
LGGEEALNLSEEIIKAIISVIATILGSAAFASSVAVLTLWSDNRSNKKALRSVFSKVRALEKKVFGHETSEADGK